MSFQCHQMGIGEIEAELKPFPAYLKGNYTIQPNSHHVFVFLIKLPLNFLWLLFVIK